MCPKSTRTPHNNSLKIGVALAQHAFGAKGGNPGVDKLVVEQ